MRHYVQCDHNKAIVLFNSAVCQMNLEVEVTHPTCDLIEITFLSEPGPKLLDVLDVLNLELMIGE